MSRSIKKGPFVEKKLYAKVMQAKSSGKRDPVKTWSRASTILPDFVGAYFSVHNGKNFISFLVTENMVGHRLGEFAPTRTFRMHSGQRKTGK